MQPKIILGYSVNVLSLVLETLKAAGEKGPIRVVQNIPVNNSCNQYIPFGIEVCVHLTGEELQLSKSALYIFGVLNPDVKKKVFDFFFEHYNIAEENYTNLVHPSSVISSTVKMKGGCYIEPLTVISPFSNLGFGVTLNRGVSIGHHTTLEDFVTVNPGANIAGHTSIGKNTSIGIGAVVFDHIRIGKNCKIGGGSVVTKDVPDNMIAWGNPCKVVKTIDA